MSTDGYPFPPAVPQHDVFSLAGRHTPPQRYWLHALLLALTLLTTTVVGTGLAQSFAAKVPFDFGFDGYVRLFHDPSFLLSGLPFSLTLLTILLAHEFGHYLAARYYHVDATLPFFLPAPTLIGTMGAFIRIRSPILARRILFDIGIAGPLAGFAVLVIPLACGVWLSNQQPGIASHGTFIFGTPPLLRLFEWIRFPGVAVADISLHPVARAAWAGLLATAINLLPIGQLDGGHILYAFVGERTKPLSRVFAVLLIPMGLFFAWMWLAWAAILLFFGMRHPAIVDPAPLSPGRRLLGFLALVVLILSFSFSPVTNGP